MNRLIAYCTCCFVFLVYTGYGISQPLAFPGAEGFGRYTTGGRGGMVYIVDNLNDDMVKPLKGSLRWAIEKEEPRIIVFAISGTIPLKGPLVINYGNLTIAGQTAPGDGICIKNFVTNIDADNVIIRFIRFRCGNEKAKSSAQDAVNSKNRKNIIIDHCSMSWSVDETASFYDNSDFTMQWCIISESLNKAGHPKGDHGFGAIWGGSGASFHHNLLASHTSRTPRFCGSRYTRNSKAELVDFRNNVIFNWGYQNVYGGEGGNHNMINNYYKAGPATQPGEKQCRILDLTRYFFDKKVRPDTLFAGNFFIEGNIVENCSNATENNWQYGVQGASDKQKSRSKVDIAFNHAPVKTQTALEAYQLVLKYAGAVLPARDAVDQRIVQEVKSGVCAYGDSWGKNSGIIDSHKSVGGWPELKSTPAPFDSDKDGMPDEWELANSLDPYNPEDRNSFMLHSDYTNLEVYLNSLVK